MKNKLILIGLLASIAAPTFADWTGAYVGGDLSILKGKDNEQVSGNTCYYYVSTSECDTSDQTKLHFGLNGGYDYQLSNGFVLGGAAAVSMGESYASDLNTFSDSTTVDLGLRAGYAISERSLAYVGAGYSQVSLDVSDLAEDAFGLDSAMGGNYFSIGLEMKSASSISYGISYKVRSVETEDGNDLGLEDDGLSLTVGYRF